MSGIPYNELQSLDCMAYSKTTYCDRFAHELPTVELDGFCAWGEKRDA